ncbi:unnamed protein product [Lactuca virosa]|uniref:Uncharacterized protein n=1 Tax=Lactuca virosa TaxID=75947 RepID=A0AAU9NQD5_9ASTR|nr:unnamed protein product [Lactuca virosa]
MVSGFLSVHLINDIGGSIIRLLNFSRHGVLKNISSALKPLSEKYTEDKGIKSKTKPMVEKKGLGKDKQGILRRTPSIGLKSCSYYRKDGCSLGDAKSKYEEKAAISRKERRYFKSTRNQWILLSNCCSYFIFLEQAYESGLKYSREAFGDFKDGSFDHEKCDSFD